MARSKRKSHSTSLAAVSSADCFDIFGPPPLLEGEDRGAYDLLLVRVFGAVKPKDIIEEMWVRDIVDLVWQIHRFRRLKVAMMSSTSSQGLQSLLEPMNLENENELIDGWLERRPEAIDEIEKILEKNNLTMDAIHAHTLMLNLDTFERIDQLIARAESRRNTAERELMRRRFTLAQALQQTLQIEDHNTNASRAA